MRLFLIAICAVLWAAAPARADLTFCNDSAGRAVLAIGYKGAEGWTSEGWWEVTAGDCATVVPGPLPLTHYYWRGSTGEEDFPAGDFYFCTSETSFTIVGDTECEARGYARERFSEIVVGQTGEATVRITGAAAPPPEPEPAAENVDLQAVLQSLQGVWHDLEESSATTIIREDRIEDRYLGIVVGNATFTLAPTCDGAGGAGPVMLVTYEGTDAGPICWIILKLDDREWQFVPAGYDEPSRMRRGV
ncbi:MAG: DUF1036 domain-containing protein [Roseovarius sp.]|uniref:DUF1036 domain-containing protein n=1 Tax=Roseovarius sp. TaxID=1486281 RepID=UPI0032EB34CB